MAAAQPIPLPNIQSTCLCVVELLHDSVVGVARARVVALIKDEQVDLGHLHKEPQCMSLASAVCKACHAEHTSVRPSWEQRRLHSAPILGLP